MLSKKQIRKNNCETFVRLGRQFYERRLMSGVTLDELAVKTNVSPQYFDKVESGKAYLSWGMLSYLAGCYGCKVNIELESCVSEAG